MERQGGGQEVGASTVEQQEVVDRSLNKRGSRKSFFPHENSKAVEQVAQQGCSVSIFEGFQDLPGLN